MSAKKTEAFELLKMRCSIFEQRAYAAEEKYNKAWSELGAVGPELAETKKKLALADELLAAANELLKKGQETMREHAGGDIELMEALRMKDLVLGNLEGNIRELAAESEWWRGQAADYQSELLAYVRDEARRAKPEVEES